jgi:hypothetical protein
MLAALLLALLADVSPSPSRFAESFGRGAESRWEVFSGTWEFKDGAAVGTAAPGDCAVLKLRRVPKGARELEFDATLLEDAGEGVHVLFAGQAFFQYRTGWTGIYPPYAQRHDTPLPAKRTVRYRLRAAGGKFELWADGVLLVSKEMAADDGAPIQLYAVRGATVKYDNVRIR